MAIIEAIPGIEVQVVVDGQPLQEYRAPPDDDDDDHKQVTRYVIAQPGKHFAVYVRRAPHCKFGAPKWDVNIRMKLDGLPVRGRFLNRNQVEKVATLDGVDQETKPGKWVKRNFVFSAIELDDEEGPLPSANQIEDAKSIGQIEITLTRGTKGDRLLATMGAVDMVSGAGKVHEKALKGKAVSRQSSLDAGVPRNAPHRSGFVAHDKEPQAKYIFRYRSEADLKAEMIIPRSTTPVPLEDRPRESLTRAELLELLSQQDTLGAVKNESQRSVKRERKSTVRPDDEDDDSDGVEIVEPLFKRKRVIETIDLT